MLKYILNDHYPFGGNDPPHTTTEWGIDATFFSIVPKKQMVKMIEVFCIVKACIV